MSVALPPISIGHHHGHGLLKLRLSPPPPPVPPPCPAIESPRCRTLLNDAAREISQLNRENQQLERQLNWAFAQRDRIEIDSGQPFAPTTRSSVSATAEGRPVYAVNPVGRIDPSTPSPRVQYQPIILDRFFMVTNLGTLLDVLV